MNFVVWIGFRGLALFCFIQWSFHCGDVSSRGLLGCDAV